MTQDIWTSHSQAGQDRFAIELCGASGTFLDIGANHPVELSNTYGLEQLGWKGWLVENEPSCVKMLREQRAAKVIAEDATRIDWSTLFRNLRTMSYLSLDVDEGSLEALRKLLPFSPRFRCITLEHDAYRFGDLRRIDMVELLKDYDYDVLCQHVCSEGLDFEIWAVDPQLVDMTKAERFRRSGPTEWREFFV